MIILEKAQKAAEAALKKAESLGITICVTVVDEHGCLILVNRMENSFVVSPDFAFAKALTSSALGLPSGDIAGYAGEGKPYQGLTAAFGGKLMVIAGGIPVKRGGKVVGAVGVGGSADVSQDAECAKAAVEVLEKE